MTVVNTHGVYGVTLGATELGGVVSCGVPINTTTDETVTDGNIYARFQSIMQQSPQPTFSTHAIAAALAVAGITGASIADDLADHVDLYAQKRADGSTRAGATSHVKYTLTQGILVPTRLSVSQEENATIDYEIFATYDGVNEPIVATGSVTIPATTDTERFGIGPVDIGGNVIGEIRSWEIDFGLNVNQAFADGDIWATFNSIDFIQPTITFRTLDATSMISDIPLSGLNGTHANTIFYLRKRAAGNGYVADVTAEHIKLTAYGVVTVEDSFAATGTDVGETTIRMTPIYDGSNAPIVIVTASAIT